MQTSIGFFTALQAAGATNTALGAVADQSQTISSNGRFILPQRMQVRGALALSANLTAARINAPSLRGLFLPAIYPGNVGATVGSPTEIYDPDDAGPWIQPNEELALETSNNAGVPVLVMGAMFLADRIDPVPPGPQYVLLATASVTNVAGAWVFGALTFDQVLPTGEYTVVGMRCAAPATLAARLVFPGYTNYRPGVICDAVYGNKQINAPWWDGRMGILGKFRNTAQPSAEFLGITAGAQTPSLFIQVVKTGS